MVQEDVRRGRIREGGCGVCADGVHMSVVAKRKAARNGWGSVVIIYPSIADSECGHTLSSRRTGVRREVVRVIEGVENTNA